MYRVAVVQNETEMLISGYANVVPRLKTLPHFKDYSFEVFTIVNLHKLFENGDSALSEFDSLFITTNATSDSAALKALRENASSIEDFLASGKGIFVGSQKKLSASHEDALKDTTGKIGKTQFLPELYEFSTRERPKSEKDSGQGKVSIDPTLKKPHDHLVAFPHQVTVQMIQHVCENNGFRRHVYRSYILPSRPGAYIPLLVDNTTDPENSRILLVANAVPQKGERVVLSTITVDWEFHQDLLVNIIAYITEGLPRLAFIDISEQKHGDFDFLLTGARLSKVGHSVYKHPNDVSVDMYAIHDTYVFSPDWDEHTVENFIDLIATRESQVARYSRKHIKVNFFRKLSRTLLLNQYSNFSSIDLVVRNAIVWLSSKFEEREWGGSFWITYDVLLMMLDLGVDVRHYIPFIYRDIEKHYFEGSYDAVTGATCGLLELTALLYHKVPDALANTKFDKAKIKQMQDWLMANKSSASEYDLQTIAITASRILRYVDGDIFQSHKQELLALQNQSKNSLQSILQHLNDYTEMDVCRYLSLCILFQMQVGACEALIQHLKHLQALNGKWTNVVRTAHVLTFLMRHSKALGELGVDVERINIADMIYQGILFLRAEYKPSMGNWDNDLQATAKAAHAIGLYNDSFQYSTQDFFRAIEKDRETMGYADSLRDLGQNMDIIRLRANSLEDRYEALVRDRNELQEKVNYSELFEVKVLRENNHVRTLATIFGSLFVSLLISLGVNHFDVFVKLVSETGSLINIVVAFALGLILTNIAQRTILKSEVVGELQRRKNSSNSRTKNAKK